MPCRHDGRPRSCIIAPAMVLVQEPVEGLVVARPADVGAAVVLFEAAGLGRSFDAVCDREFSAVFFDFPSVSGSELGFRDDLNAFRVNGLLADDARAGYLGHDCTSGTKK